MDFIFNDKELKIRTHKSGYIINSLLNEGDGQPFLDRTPFSYLKPNSVIIGIENKQTVLEHNKEKIIDIKIKDNKLILECSMYLKNNAFDYPITSLCKNKNSILIFEEIK